MHYPANPTETRLSRAFGDRVGFPGFLFHTSTSPAAFGIILTSSSAT
jgi:hypothetical protein